jgi:hypothetical protein
MLGVQKRKLNLRSWPLHAISLATLWLGLSLWIRPTTVDPTSRANAERRAVFGGLWPPMFWLIRDVLERTGS